MAVWLGFYRDGTLSALLPGLNPILTPATATSARMGTKVGLTGELWPSESPLRTWEMERLRRLMGMGRTRGTP